MKLFLFWSHRIFFVSILRPKSPKSVVKRPSYGAGLTYTQSDMAFFSAYAIISFALRARNK
jgi:hypothetical protein